MKKVDYEVLRAQLKNEQQSFIPHWRDLSEYILPRRSRFFVSDVNKGERRNLKIIDSTATLSSRTLRSGMMSGITSPARPWFRLTTQDPGMSESGAVKQWLHTVTERMGTVFLKSNLYNTLATVYGDLGTFATGAMMIEEDFDDVIRCYCFPVGSYMIGQSEKYKVDIFFREMQMTVRQLIYKFADRNSDGSFDLSIFSPGVKYAWENNQREQWVNVCHVVMPNDEYDPNKLESRYKKFVSCYYESAYGSNGGTFAADLQDEGKYLRKSGYDMFQFLVPRWELTGEDAYGSDCPGMTALGDIKQLQLGEKRSAQAIEKKVNPPMVGPTSLRTSKATILPGDITYTDEREGQKGFRPAHEVNLNVSELEQKQEQVRERIRRAFYEDLFLMMSQSDRREITAREIDERREEKFLALGPVLEQLNQDLLDPLIDITFSIMSRQGLIPPPPEELQGMPLKVEYLSVMSQAQKLVGISTVERFAGFVGNLVAQTGNPSVLDKVDVDQMVDVYGDLTSVPPGIVRPDEDVAMIRQERAKAQQAQAVAQNVQQMASSAKDLSQTDMEKDSALTRILKQAEAGQLVSQ